MPIPPRSEEELNARLKAFISSVKGQRGALFSALLMPELVSSSLETGDVIASFTATADMRAADGFMAPGMVAALFDNALGMLSIGQMGNDTFTPTVDLHVNYYQSVPVGVPLRLHVRKERQTAQYVFLSARLYREDDPHTLLGLATGSFYISRMPA